jgi:hypothetical protein
MDNKTDRAMPSSAEQGARFPWLNSSSERPGDVMVLADTPAEAVPLAAGAAALGDIGLRPSDGPAGRPAVAEGAVG